MWISCFWCLRLWLFARFTFDAGSGSGLTYGFSWLGFKLMHVWVCKFWPPTITPFWCSQLKLQMKYQVQKILFASNVRGEAPSTPGTQQRRYRSHVIDFPSSKTPALEALAWVHPHKRHPHLRCHPAAADPENMRGDSKICREINWRSPAPRVLFPSISHK